MTELRDHAGLGSPAIAADGGEASGADLAVAVAPPPHWWRAGLLHGRGVAGLILIGIVVLLGIFAPLLAPFDPNQQLPDANLLPASSIHWLGTDQVNRDVLSRVLYGIRIDLVIIFVAVPIGALIGGGLALIASLTNPSDVALQRLFDVLLAFPSLILAIALTAVMGPGALTIVIVIALVEIPVFGRILRSGILTVRSLSFVDVAETLGARKHWVLRKHVLPNAAEPLWVQVALSLSVAVFLESAMSFLGIGVRPPDPSLGSLVSDAVTYLDINPALALGPLVIIIVLVLGFQLLAQGIGAARRA
jgi:peptide/nickel transport system permease protein